MKHIQIISNLVINTKNKTIANQDGKQVTLRPLAYDVLQVLIKNDGLAVSRDELFAQCWTGCIVSDQALTNVISNIRQTLLRLRAEGVEVLTVNKVGYRFCITKHQHPALLKKFNVDDKYIAPEHEEELTQTKSDTVTKGHPNQDSTTQHETVHASAHNQNNFTRFLLGLIRSTKAGSIIDNNNCYLNHSRESGVLQILVLLIALSLLAITVYCSIVHAKDRIDLDQRHFEKLTNDNKTLYVNDESEYLLALQVLNNAIYAGDLIGSECPVSLLIQFSESSDHVNEYSLYVQVFDRGDIDELKYSYSSLSQNELIPAINSILNSSNSLCSY